MSPYDDTDPMWRPWDVTEEPSFMAKVTAAMERAEEKGLDEDAAMEKVLEAIAEGLDHAIDESGARIADRLRATAPRMLAEHRKIRRDFEYRLEWVWSEGLDLLYGVLVCCQELGESFWSAHCEEAAAKQDHRFQALVSVHARACLTASEIHALLRTGHALGALARWRTLHELAVVASILGDGDDDLGNRFMLHAAAEAYEDAELHEKHRARTGRKPYPADALAELKSIHDAVLSQYGPKFARSWRWAEPVTAPEVPEFWRLEKIAGLDHLHPDYRISTHLLHGGSRGTDLGRVDYGDREVLLAGPSNGGLAEAGHGAAISLVQVTTSLVINGREEFDYHPQVTAALRALLALCDATGDAFLRGDAALERLKVDFDRAEAGGVAAKVANNVRRSLRRGWWRLSRKARELRPR